MSGSESRLTTISKDSEVVASAKRNLYHHTHHLKAVMGDPRIAQLQATVRERETLIRESWVRAMEARIVHEELRKCQKTEGVNHYEACREFSELYLQMLKDNRVQGYKQVDV